MGGCFRMSSTPRAATGVRTRPSSASSASGEAAIGLICTNWYGWGTHFPLIQEIFQSVYARGKGAGPKEDVGTASWMRGMLRALLTTEALRTAMRHFGHQPMTGAQVQWGLE